MRALAHYPPPQVQRWPNQKTENVPENTHFKITF